MRLARPVLSRLSVGFLTFGILAVGIASACTAADEGAPIALHKRWATAAAYSSQGVLATTGGESLQYRPGDVLLWDAEGKQVASLEGHPTNVWACTFSPDGALLATTGYDGLIIVWDVAARKEKGKLDTIKGWVRDAAFSPDGATLAVAREDGKVTLLKTEDLSEVKSIEAHAGAVFSLAFSPDGATLATGGVDKLVKLWNVADGAEKAKLEGHTDAVWSVAYNADGTKLATAGADRMIKIWNAENKEEASLTGHHDWVTQIAFSADGAQLASSSLDRTARLWNIAEKKEAAKLEGYASSVWCVAYSPKGDRLATGSHKGIKIWTLPENTETFPVPMK